MPEAFRLRRHPRARRVTLRVKPDASLVVTAPPGVPERSIRKFVTERGEWIARARSRLRRARRPELDETHPRRLDLPAVGRVLEVGYADSGGRPKWRVSGPDRVELRGAGEPPAARALLVDVLKTVARGSLEPRVRELADEHRLLPARITWRNQSSRWGSCSSNRNLSLNVRLLLLAPETAEYVLIHELAHLEHP
ncbi:MAG: YgjP-like metallopeptidase domain-containing protein, partial [Wenzhouxiangellaceae bacterium]|nr:YgjP-like metallopeptidase domain-containing protein [Wenzhouxiangellaceae bacterium]